MNNDAAQHDFAHVLAVVQQQMRDLSMLQQRRSELTAKATAADGTVEVTVDARSMVTRTVIDESYLDDFEFADLGGHITSAAQEAVQEVERLATELLAPLTQRREEISSMSGLVADAPEFGELMSGFGSFAPVEEPGRGSDGDDVGEGSHYPVVRR